MSDGRRMSYEPALDGVRGISVIAVVLFHAGVMGFNGGYIGVSVFFTLSGYLITALMIREHLHTGKIDAPAFYARRIRRLLPASLACIVGVMLASALTDWFSSVGDLQAQVVGSALQVENWVLLAGKDSYQNLLARGAGEASPLAHFWSLGVEEQFYWIWPLVMIVAFKIAARLYRDRLIPRQRTVATVVVGLALLSSISAPVIARVWGPDAAYWATPARIAEILIGASVAVLISVRSIPGWAAVVGWFGLAALALCVVFFPPDGGPAYNGLLPLVALASAALVLGAQVEGRLRALLSVSVLVWIGKVSYGAYLYHWPIFVVVTAERTGWSPLMVFAVRIALTAIATVVSYFYLEQPARHTPRVTRPLTFSSGLAATGVVVLLAGQVVPPNNPYWEADTASAAEVAIEPVSVKAVGDAGSAEGVGLVAATPPPAPTTSSTIATPSESNPTGSTPNGFNPDGSTPGGSTTVAPSGSVVPTPRPTTSVGTATTAAPTTTLVELDRPLRVITAGDSTAGALSNGLIEWAVDHQGDMQVQDVHYGGCGVLTGGERFLEGWQEVPSGCDRLIQVDLPNTVEKLQPDVVMISVAVWDLMDRRWDGAVYSPFDQVYRDRLLYDYTAVVNRSLDAGAGSVALILNPPSHTNWDNHESSDDPARHRVLAQIVEEIAAGDPARIRVVDLWTFIEDQDLDEDREARPDGVHWTQESATKIAEDFLADQLFITAGAEPPASTASDR